MAHAPLPPPRGAKVGNEGCPISNPLQNTIWRTCDIEVPVVEFRGIRYIRVSCHLYNNTEQIDRLVRGLASLLAAGH